MLNSHNFDDHFKKKESIFPFMSYTTKLAWLNHYVGGALQRVVNDLDRGREGDFNALYRDTCISDLLELADSGLPLGELSQGGFEEVLSLAQGNWNAPKELTRLYIRLKEVSGKRVDRDICRILNGE